MLLILFPVYFSPMKLYLNAFENFDVNKGFTLLMKMLLLAILYIHACNHEHESFRMVKSNVGMVSHHSNLGKC